MSQAIQSATTSAALLARPELLSHGKAAAYLTGRMWIRTPLGAAEYLQMLTKFDRKMWDERLELADTLNGIYREMFKREYDSSGAPPFSVTREHELYRLISRQLFPLPLEPLDLDPDFFYPAIPVTGTQQHDWIDGCCPFDTLQLVFKLALLLSGSKPDAWKSLGLVQPPAGLLGAVGWTHFCYACAVDPSPLQYLPRVFPR